MKRRQQDKRLPHRPGSPEPLSKRRFTRPVILSLILHGLLLVFLAINFKSFLPRNTTNYPVTLTPLGSSGEGAGGGAASMPVTVPPTVEQTAPPVETPKPEPKKPAVKKPEPERKPQPSKDQKPDKVSAKKDTVEGLKKSDKKKKSEPVQESPYSYKDTQAKIAKMSKEVEARHTGEGQSGTAQGQAGEGAGGLGSGTPGRGGGTEVSAYLISVKEKVTQEWVLPENLSMTNSNLETTISFFIDRAGRVQKLRFIKKSGNDLYDQAAMRAVKKAEPFSRIPIGLIDEEIGLNFNQQSGIGSGGRP